MELLVRSERHFDLLCAEPPISVVKRKIMPMHLPKKDIIGILAKRLLYPNNTPLNNSVTSTKNFFVRNISRKGLHKNFSVQGIIIREVQNAICVSDTPRSLNINTETRLMAIKGSPIAK